MADENGLIPNISLTALIAILSGAYRGEERPDKLAVESEKVLDCV